MSRPFLVELPGIEPDTQIALTYGNAEIATRDYAKRHQTTCGYAKGVDAINIQ